MEEKGIVRKVLNGTAIVEITGSSSHCHSCPLHKVCGERKTIEAKNKIGAKEGEEVSVYIPEGVGWTIAFLNFTIPVFLLIIGIVAGKAIFHTDLYSFITGITLLAIYWVILIPIDKKLRSRTILPEIKDVIGSIDRE